MARVVYTVGHAGRKLEELLGLLLRASVDVVVDVRRWPSSRKSPWFSKRSLEEKLGEAGISYLWMGEELGGYRRLGVDVEDDGSARCFESRGFTAYAQYMLRSPVAQNALRRLEELASERTAAILCAEKIPWACHRKLLSDWLVYRGFRVLHILDPGRIVEHKLTRCAVIEHGRLRYR